MLKVLMARYLPVSALLVTVQALFLACILPQSQARDLTDVLIEGFSFQLFGKDTTAETNAVGPTYAAALSAAVAPAVTQEFPLASVAPAFTYRFNPATDVFERSTSVPGPLFSERALTLGKGQLNFGVGYSFIDFTELNGTDLGDIRNPAPLTETITDPTDPTDPKIVMGSLPNGELVPFGPVVISQVRSRIDLQAHVIVPTLRYGITPYWDMSLTIPIVNTFLRVKNGLVRVLDTDARVPFRCERCDVHEKPDPLDVGIDREGNRFGTGTAVVGFWKSRRPPITLSKAAGSATGVGDVALRTKYHFWRTETGGAALGLNLQFPTGEVRNFHGTNETHLSTFLYLSQVLGDRFEPHLNVGVDFNADDVDRSSFLYAVGGTLLVGRKLGLIVDFIGRSEFAKFPVPTVSNPLEFQTAVFLSKLPATCTAAQPCALKAGTEFTVKNRKLENQESFFPPPVKLRRNDVANFTFGLRYALGTSGSAFFGGVVPLNDDGLRPDFIPAGGVEYTF
jgi:hypothetical protein